MIRIAVVLCIGIVALDAVKYAIHLFSELRRAIAAGRGFGVRYRIRRRGIRSRDGDVVRRFRNGTFGVWLALVPMTILLQLLLVVLGFGLGSNKRSARS